MIATGRQSPSIVHPYTPTPLHPYLPLLSACHLMSTHGYLLLIMLGLQQGRPRHHDWHLY